MKWVALILTMLSAPALAQDACGSLEDLDSHLSEQYGEVLVWTGQSAVSGRVYLIYLDPEDGSWTVLQMARSGKVCMMDGGYSGSLAVELE